eukprot:TRINITY_DN15402_c0_g1_i1.p1 TRINITY_DN15402_c0_g1~~TRINITY_DN15402_c0_g1_i1.p1  ORF type:complete len:329 (+),score=97.98 TRINITY_DN15402_c0_g1_i1:210-1196(+)
MEYESNIRSKINNVISKVDLKLGNEWKKKEGKVRDSFFGDSQLLLVTTDRISAFDRHLTSIPYKGKVLNGVSIWWFERTKEIVPNHFISSPDPNTILCKKATVFPIEFVVRGYMTGTTETSLWTHYQRGERSYCGHQIPDGLIKNQKLERSLVTPTTKSDEHDELISAEEIVKQGFMSQQDWDAVSKKALELFEFGQKTAKEHGLILVDTKYEFGKDSEGNIILVDEIHTPDSSRYWLADTYEERFSKGDNPDNIDKDIIRNWYKQHCDPYKDEKLPEAPEDLVVLLSQRYIQLYEIITGSKFNFADSQLSAHEQLVHNLNKAGFTKA